MQKLVLGEKVILKKTGEEFTVVEVKEEDNTAVSVSSSGESNLYTEEESNEA